MGPLSNFLDSDNEQHSDGSNKKSNTRNANQASLTNNKQKHKTRRRNVASGIERRRNKRMSW